MLMLFFIMAIFATSVVHANGCDDQFVKGQRPIPVNPVMKTRLTAVCEPNGFESMNWGVSRSGLWSAEHLTPQRVRDGKRIKRVDSFHEEMSVPVADRATLNDFLRSGYDRGHLSPNKDFGDSKSQEACFSLANMVAQNPDNNRNLWEGVESAVRQYVLDHGDVYIITGPIFPGHGQQAEFLRRRVMIPINMYKIVYDPRLNKASVYLTKNAPGMAWESKSVSEISELAQIDFFPWMSDSDKRNARLDLPTPTPHGHGGHSEGGGQSEGGQGSGYSHAGSEVGGALRAAHYAHMAARFFH